MVWQLGRVADVSSRFAGTCFRLVTRDASPVLVTRRWLGQVAKNCVEGFPSKVHGDQTPLAIDDDGTRNRLDPEALAEGSLQTPAIVNLGPGHVMTEQKATHRTPMGGVQADPEDHQILARQFLVNAAQIR